MSELITQNPPNSILIHREGNFAVITINRPEKMNCLTLATIEKLEDALDDLSKLSGLCTLIFAGAGGIFSAGADLDEISALTPATAYDFSIRGQKMLSSFNQVAPLTIAAIDGHCIGGGLDIALSCDLRFASLQATFQHPGARRGIITGWGGTQRLPRLIGADAALRMLLTGERLDAEQAQRIGLINGIHEDALSHAVDFAIEIEKHFDRETLFKIKNFLD